MNPIAWWRERQRRNWEAMSLWRRAARRPINKPYTVDHDQPTETPE